VNFQFPTLYINHLLHQQVLTLRLSRMTNIVREIFGGSGLSSHRH